VADRPRIVRRVHKLLEKALVETPRSKILEWRIIQSYVWVLRAPQIHDGNRTSTLVRHGAYEVRLVEPSQMPQGDAIPFWIELFDHEKQMALDSFATDDLEEAAVTASALISEAEMLHQRRTRLPERGDE
jgi:hypothetical protein